MEFELPNVQCPTTREFSDTPSQNLNLFNAKKYKHSSILRLTKIKVVASQFLKWKPFYNKMYSLLDSTMVSLFTNSWIGRQQALTRCQKAKSACFRGCKFTLIALVCFFSSVRFQICPQMACVRGCKVTLAAPMWRVSVITMKAPWSKGGSQPPTRTTSQCDFLMKLP